MASRLKEFLISIGFDVNEQQQRKFAVTLETVGRRFSEMGEFATTATTAVVAGVLKIASSMETLYYAAKLSGTTVSGLKALRFGAEQVGVSAETATQAIQAFAQVLRTNPGMQGRLTGLIGPHGTDNLENFLKLLERLRNLPHWQGAQLAQQFGLDEQTFTLLEAQLPQLEKLVEMQRKLFAAQGTDDAARRMVELQNAWRVFRTEVEKLEVIVAARWLPTVEHLLSQGTRLIDMLIALDARTNGFSSKVIGLVAALGGAAAALKLVWGIGSKVFGLGGGVAAAEGAGEAAATGAGALTGGLLGAAALALAAPAGKILGDIVYDFQHPNERAGSAGAQAAGFVTSMRALVKAVAQQESGGHQYNPDGSIKTSAKGALGIMQLMPNTAAALGVDPGDPQQNLAGGRTLLQNLIAKYHNLALTLAAYNWGEGNLDKYLKGGKGALPKETEDYVAGILKRLGDTSYATELSSAVGQARLGTTGGGSVGKLIVESKTDINVHGVDSPQSTAQAVGKVQSRRDADLLRNLAGAVN